jgi:Flp pilus assembly protein TadD
MASAHFARGVILRLLGRLPDAERAFRTANQLRPGSVDVLRDLVRCLGEQKKPRDALPFAQEAARIEPADAGVLGNLAMCLMQCGQIEQSQRIIEQALEIDPNDEINLRIRNWVLSRSS